jgi:hypothetical protein
MCIRVVDVFQCCRITDCDAPRQARERIGERIGARPAHPLEDRRQMPWVAGADEPEAAIFGRTENQIMTAEEPESLGDVGSSERRDVAPDENRRARGAGGECATHPVAEIPPTLADNLHPGPPMTGAATGAIRGHRNSQAPAAVPAETAQEPRDHKPLEAHRRDIADLAGEPSLAAPERWCPHEQNEGAAHQP